ncbi:hypothetical protein HDV04_004492 [Boothiomyces sp. JEL0838]|nr:hypothetical protein HDV04_004492 [Boothiomyces sp. JEL0838]
MERRLLTTVSCTASDLRFYAEYNPEWEQFISRQDFQLLLDHLNKATGKAPNKFITWTLYFLAFSALVTEFVLGLGTNYSFWILLIPFSAMLLFMTTLGIYKSEMLTVLDTELRQAIARSTEEMKSPNVLLQYSRNLFWEQNIKPGLAEEKFDYIVYIYILQSVDAPLPALLKNEQTIPIEIDDQTE